MAVLNFLVNTLPAYVQTNRDVILSNFALVGRDTRSRIGVQTGIKKSAYLNYLNVQPVLQDGNNCVFNPLDSITLTQREINVAIFKVDGEICDKTLVGKYAEYLVRINANENDLPFERYIVDGLVAEINKAIERVIWQGNTSAQSNPDLINGFLTQFGSDNSVVKVSIASGASAYAGISQVYAAMTEEAIERGALIFVAPAIFRAFMMEMVALNLFHYSGAVNDDPDEFILPGSSARVVKTPGLAGSLKIVGTFGDNLVYGTDMENDEEDFLIDFDRKNRTWYYHAEWASGVAYHFPAHIVQGTFAAAPVAPAPGVTALGQIAANTASE